MSNMNEGSSQQLTDKQVQEMLNKYKLDNTTGCCIQQHISDSKALLKDRVNYLASQIESLNIIIAMLPTQMTEQQKIAFNSLIYSTK
jgi:hypothetical protein